MSTTYNRRRGASARRPRIPRQCAHTDPVPEPGASNGLGRCPRVAPVNRYCPDHQRAKAIEVPRPISAALEEQRRRQRESFLARQANRRRGVA
jgi:hypothetical protein